MSANGFPRFGLAWKLALRELRGGLRGFRTFLFCLALGVAAIAGVGSLGQAINAGLADSARELFGGDLEVRLTHRDVSAEGRAALDALGRVSRTASLRAMARTEAGERTLVDLKAVDAAYPLYGRLELANGGDATATLADTSATSGASGIIFGGAVEDRLLAQLNAKLGDVVTVGDARVRLGAVIAREPDRAAGFLALGPRLLISRQALEASGLERPGSLVQYAYRLRLHTGAGGGAAAPDLVRQAAGSLKERFGGEGWRVRDFVEGAPRVGGFVDRVAFFLTLVGLTAMLTGGVGVAGAVSAWLETKQGTIAVLKTLGASRRDVLAAYFLQLLVLAGLGAGLGVLAGAAAPWLFASVLGGLLPAPIKTGLYPAPLALAASVGLLTALLFSLGPLFSAQLTPPAMLFRGEADPRPRPLGISAWIAIGLTGLALAGLVLAASGDRKVGLGFILGAAAAFAVFQLLTLGLVRLAGRLRPRDPRARLGLANIPRPGSAAGRVIFSLGLGLTALTVTALTDANLRAKVDEDIPRRAPAYFFVDIQPDQADEFKRLAVDPAVDRVEVQPSLRARIAAIKGVPVEQATVAPEASWATQSDRGLSFSPAPPPGTVIVKGDWWPEDYRGPTLISMDAQIARGFGVDLGDEIVFNVLGREVAGRIANLRRIDWTSLTINHVFILSPGVLDAAPYTSIATLSARPGASDAEVDRVYRRITDALPNVSAISTRSALKDVAGALEKIGWALRAAALTTLAAGLAVLAQSLSANLARRRREATLLKVFGATRRDVLLAYLAEYAFLGVATALPAAGLGTLLAWIFTETTLRLDFAPQPLPTLAAALGGALVAVLLGLVSLRRALGQEVWPTLRNE